MKKLPNLLKFTRYLLPGRLVRKIPPAKRKYFYVGVGGLIVVLVPLIFGELFFPKGSRAAWFDDNWAYRKEIPITAHTSQENNVYITTGSSSESTFGQTGNGSNSSTSSGDSELVNRHTEPNSSPASSGVLTSIKARLHVTVESTEVIGIVYDSSGNLIATSDEVIISNTSEEEITLPFSGAQQVSLTGGASYSYGIMWDDPGTGSIVWSRQSVSSTSIKNNTTFPNAPNPLVATGTVAGPVDIYVTYSVVSGGIDTSDTTKFQSDCGDLRFTDQGGNLLPYYIVSGCGTANTIVHINFDTFPAGAQSIYYYYGNPSAPNGFSSSGFSTLASNYSLGTIGSEEEVDAPIGYWKLDEGTGVTTYDSSSQKNNGTISGATWQQNDACARWLCLLFDGSNDNVNLGDTTASEFADGADFSLSIWAKSDLSATGTVMAKKASTDAADAGYMINIETDGDVVFYASDGTDQFTMTATGKVTANQWVNIVVVYDDDSTSNTTIYVNGLDVNPAQSGTLANVNGIGVTSQPLKLGSESDDAAYFDGYIDETKIYSYALSSDEVKSNYNRAAILGDNDNYSTLGAPDPQVSKGSFAKSNCTATCSQQVTGVGFQPKAVIFYWTNQTAEGFASDFYWGTGFSSGTSQNGSVSVWAEDNQPTSDTGRIGTNSYAITMQTANGTKVAQAAISSFDSDGFTLSWSTNNTSQYIIHYVAIGGSAITNAKVGSFTMTSAAGSESVTDVGFKPDFLMILSAQETNGANNSYGIINMGYSTGPDSQVASAFALEDAQGVADSWRWQVTDSALIGTNGVGAVAWNAPISSFDTGGFTYRKDDPPAGDMPTLYLALKGGKYKVGSLTQPTSNGTQSVVTGFQPTGVFMSSMNAVASPSVGSNASVSLGAATTTAEGATWAEDVDAADPTNTNMSTVTTKAIRLASSNSTTNAEADLSSVSSSGFTLDWTTTDATAREILYFAIGQEVRETTPLGYWKMDEGYGTSVGNSGSGGSVLAGSLSSGTPSWRIDGKFGDALFFNSTKTGASATYVDLGDKTDYERTTFTVSAWVNRSGSCPFSNCTVFAKGTSSNIGYALQVKDAGSGYKASMNLRDSQEVYGTTTLEAGKWYHIAASIDGSTVKVYVNGRLETSTAQTQTPSYSTETAKIGNKNDGLDVGFNGLIDEVKFFTSALSASEVKIDYNRGSGVVLGAFGTDPTDGKTASNAASAIYCVPGDTTTSACQPIGEWRFEQASGATANDTSAQGSNGSLVAGASANSDPKWVRGKVGGALDFNGVDGNVTIGTQSIYTDLTTRSFSLWVYPRSTGESSGRAFSKERWYLGSTSNNRMTFLADFSTSDGTWITPTNSVPLNTWTHIAVVYDRSSTANDPSIYINGRLVTNNEFSSPSGTYVSDSSNPLYIGNNNQGRTFDGLVDEVRLYNYLLTPAQVAWDYNRGKPAAYYKLDECQGATANDSSGNGYSGAITIATGTQTAVGTCTTSGTAWGNGVNGKYNYSLNFDGDGDYVDSGDMTFTEGASALTWSMWVKPGTLSTQDCLLCKFNNAASQRSWAIETGGSDSSKVRVSVSTSASDDATYGETPAGVLSNGSWTHIVGVYDGTQTGNSNRLKIYVNGVPQAVSFTGTVPASTQATTSTMRLAASSDGSRYYNGQADEVQVFNYPLTPLQVKMLYNQSSGVRWGPATGAP
jgi:hypothetical protein